MRVVDTPKGREALVDLSWLRLPVNDPSAKARLLRRAFFLPCPRELICRVTPSPDIETLIAIMARAQDARTADAPWDLAQTPRQPRALRSRRSLRSRRRGRARHRDRPPRRAGRPCFSRSCSTRKSRARPAASPSPTWSAPSRRRWSGAIPTSSPGLEPPRERPMTVVADLGAHQGGRARRRKARRRRVLDDVPLALPGLTRAVKLQTKASRVGFDWGDPRLVLAKIREEVDEIAGSARSGGLRSRRPRWRTRSATCCSPSRTWPDMPAPIRKPRFAVRTPSSSGASPISRIASPSAGRSPARSSLEEMDGLWDEAKAAGL